MTPIRTILGGMSLACVIATLLAFYYASVSKVPLDTAATHKRVLARSLPAPRVAP
jgi:hypothetical protein